MKNIFSRAIITTIACSAALFGCSDDKKVDIYLIDRIEVSNAENNVIYVKPGEIFQVEMSVSPSNAVDAEGVEFEYFSENESVFTADVNGLITVAGEGEANLKVHIKGNTDIYTRCTVKSSVTRQIIYVESINMDPDLESTVYFVDNKVSLMTYLTVLPENSSNPVLQFSSSNREIATVNSLGVVDCLKEGDVVITVSAIDGSGTTITVNISVREMKFALLERNGWTASTSHPYVSDNTANGSPASLFDEDNVSCLILRKPGRTLGGITIPADDIVYFDIDLQSVQKFNYFIWEHRSDNVMTVLRAYEVMLHGSNDGIDFVELETVEIPTGPLSNTLYLNNTYEYQYLRVQYTKWNTDPTQGNSIQVSEFYLGRYYHE